MDKTELWKKLMKKDFEPAMREFYEDSRLRREGDLLVWWVPQIPMQAFYVACEKIEEAKLVLQTLARYDQFQYDHKVKGDYANTGGLMVFTDEGWLEWDDPETGDDINQIMREES